MMKDYYEDLKRKKADDNENNKEVSVILNSNGERGLFKCKDLKVGHIIYVRNNLKLFIFYYKKQALKR